MKRLRVSLIIGLLSFTSQLFFTGPVPRYKISPGEYFSVIMDATGVGYTVVGIPVAISGATSLVNAAAGTHGYICTNGTKITTGGDNDSYGQSGRGSTSFSSYGPADVTADNLGNTFSNIIMVGSGGTLVGWTNWFVEQGVVTDTLFAAGATDGDIHHAGSGTDTKFTKIAWVTGKHIKKIQMDVICMMLFTDGTFADFGGSTAGFATQYILGQGTATPITATPTFISFPGRTVVDIAGGSFWNFVLLDNGVVKGCAYYRGYLAIGFQGGAYNTPSATNTYDLLDTALNFSHPVAKIGTNGNGTYAILTDSTLWFWGDNANGGAGQGYELNYATYPNGTSSAIWNWDQGLGELMLTKPVQISPGKHNFTDIFCTNALNYWVEFQDANGNVFGCGRNKGGVMGDGSVGAGGAGSIGATYPNSWDNTYLKLLTPFATSTFPVTCPFCIANPSGVPCNNYTIPTHSAPTSVFTITYINGMLILDGSLSTDLSGHIYHSLFRQATGPALQMGVQDAPKDTIYGAVAGQTYGFRFTAINPTWDSTAVVLSFTVPPIIPKDRIPRRFFSHAPFWR